MTKQVNLFTSNLEGRALIAEKAATRKATAAAVVANCFPYQSAAGELLTRAAVRDFDGALIGYVWTVKKLTAAAARGIVRAALDNFTKTVGAPVVEYHEPGEKA